MKQFKLCAFADEADKDLKGQIDVLNKHNIEFLEIRGVGEENIADISMQKAIDIKNTLDNNGVKIWSIGSPIGKINIADDFEPHLDKFKHLLEIADVLDAKAFRLFSFFMPDNQNPNDYKDEVLERLNKFCEVAKGTNITLCHENEKAIYGDVVERCIEIHKNLPQLKAVFDPANFVQCGVEPVEAFEKLKDNIFYMHIKDSLKNGDIVPAGKGDGKIQELLNIYNGEIITLEPHLFEFSGLSGLEKEGDRSGVGSYNFKNAKEAFDAAVIALNGILKG